MASSSAPSSLGRRVSCFPCRSSKRRCDKTLPACQLCRRKDIECRYPRRRGQTSASPPDTSCNDHAETIVAHSLSPVVARTRPTESVVSLSSAARSGQTIATTNTPISSSSSSSATFATTTAIRFLAPDLFRELRLQVSGREWQVPDDVAFQLGGPQQMQDVTITFLRQTRSWMPIVNGKRHLAAVLNPLLTPLRRPTALLALCMKLLCLSMSDRTGGLQGRPLYFLAKALYAEVERTNDLSLNVIQAAVFIAVYEIGEAIYPAAYLTIGNAARYGIAMGLDKINRDRMGSSGLDAATAGVPWIDIEEMRRVWWGVLVLDRLLNVSHPTWSLVTADPAIEDFLPVDDEKFYNATATPEDALPISEAFHQRLGSFARLCQATYLISKALVLTRFAPGDSFGSARDDLPCDAAQLCRTLEALVRANEFEVRIRKLAFCSQTTVSYIGVLLLQQHLWEQQVNGGSAQDAQQHIFPETQYAIDTLDRISKALRYGEPGDRPWPSSDRCITLFFVDLVYRAILTLMMMEQRLPSLEFQDKTESLRWLLGHMGGRWQLVAVYENILEAKQAVMTATAI